ncbi:hypothetical protein [Sinorhizobium fredii]|uniref:hypothetical protein n=1 Tax=Rhizobium fredii TaxID=380 RepID=UPI0004B4F179|nr:hypothetical protein [Sinorhizobium fredii]ASY69393.1 Phage protein [Sinorhizobium fredii CCBAU 83666]
MRGELSTAMVDVMNERDRQVNEEGWTAEHDDRHKRGHLARAGACYALRQSTDATGYRAWLGWAIENIWPFDWSWWKPRDYRRNLVRAAALIIAEIERFDRAAEKAGEK